MNLTKMHHTRKEELLWIQHPADFRKLVWWSSNNWRNEKSFFILRSPSPKNYRQSPSASDLWMPPLQLKELVQISLHSERQKLVISWHVKTLRFFRCNQIGTQSWNGYPKIHTCLCILHGSKNKSNVSWVSSPIFFPQGPEKHQLKRWTPGHCKNAYDIRSHVAMSG